MNGQLTYTTTLHPPPEDIGITTVIVEVCMRFSIVDYTFQSQFRTFIYTYINFQSSRTGGLCRIWGSLSGGYEDFNLLRYNAIQFVDSQLTFQRNTSLSSSGSKTKPSEKWAWRQVPNRVWRSKRYVLPKRRLTFNGLHDVIFQKI
jgi:hypothetical protein